MTRLDPETLRYDAASVLADGFTGEFTLDDGRAYTVRRVDRDEDDIIVEVGPTRRLKVEPDLFRLRVVVERYE